MQFNEQQRLTVICALFNRLFSSHRTYLIGGAQEPIYIPAGKSEQFHQLVYRGDYVSSALHEVAHWCIAGPERLLQEDFGYWYRPDGRSASEQRQFEAVEIKPQALEWMFSIACGHKFTPSMDNLNTPGNSHSNAVQSFKKAVATQCLNWCDSAKMPLRAKQFIDVLVANFDGADPHDARFYQCALRH